MLFIPNFTKQDTSIKSKLLSEKHKITFTCLMLTFSTLYLKLKYTNHSNPQLFKQKWLILISRNKFFKDDRNQVVSSLLMSDLTKRCKPNVKKTNTKHCNTCGVLQPVSTSTKVNASCGSSSYMHYICTTSVNKHLKLHYFCTTTTK